MSAQLVNKIACGIYGTVFSAIGAFTVAIGCVLIYWTANGIPPQIDSQILAKIDNPELVHNMLPALAGGFVVFGLILTALGVFAWLRYLSAVVIGFLLWTFMFGSPVLKGTGGFGTHKFEIVSTIVLALVMIIAAVARRASRTTATA